MEGTNSNAGERALTVGYEDNPFTLTIFHSLSLSLSDADDS